VQIARMAKKSSKFWGLKIPCPFLIYKHCAHFGSLVTWTSWENIIPFWTAVPSTLDSC
jgi:hypothetical protein